MKCTKYPELKKDLKNLAQELKKWKSSRKLNKRLQLKMPLWEIESKIYRLKVEFRHKHIAYCMLRGRSYEQIESYCRVSPDFNRVECIMGQYEQKAVCVSA